MGESEDLRAKLTAIAHKRNGQRTAEGAQRVTLAEEEPGKVDAADREEQGRTAANHPEGIGKRKSDNSLQEGPERRCRARRCRRHHSSSLVGWWFTQQQDNGHLIAG